MKSGLTVRYLVALGIIAGVLLTNHGLMGRQTTEMALDGRIINISGMQRMLSQRVALHAVELRAAPDEAVADGHVEALEKALARFEANHVELSREWRERAAAREAPYVAYLAEGGLNREVLDFLALGRGFLETYRSGGLGAARGSALPERIAAAAAGEGLLERLDAVVSRHEGEFEAKMHALARLERAVLALGLLALVFEALLIFRPMTSTIARTIAALERANEELARRGLALAGKNEELENYAHVVSHDLKTPIRGIQSLTTFLKEDLGDYLASNEANPDVELNLAHLEHQAAKSEVLITSILDYSSVGVLDEALSVVDVGALVGEIGATLGVRPEQLVVEGELPVFETHAARLEQVIANLVGNAFKYHPDRERALVRVSATREGAFHRFVVADDGLGIEARFHERIFEAFAKLQADHGQPSSGIGLSIVRKSVELLGGSVSVESEPGHGATFRFDWPVASVRRAA